MRTAYDSELDGTVTLDESGKIHGIHYVGSQQRKTEHSTAREAAIARVRDVAGALKILSETLERLEESVSYYDPRPERIEYRLSDEKVLFDTTTFVYYQTYLNTPVWGAGITVTAKESPARVLAITNTSEQGINAEMPSPEALERYRRLFSVAEKTGLPRQATAVEGEAPDAQSSALLEEILGNAAKRSRRREGRQPTQKLISGRFFIYRYQSEKRVSDHPPGLTEPAGGAEKEDDTPLTFPLSPVPKSIHEGHWYVVAEIILPMALDGRSINWRLLVEVETNAILYVRALISGINGLAFINDPITATGNATNSPAATTATLNPRRSSVPLLGLTAPTPPADQALTGNFVQISDFELATAAPPTQPVGFDFNYDSRTNNFAAVNAYYHCDRFFRLVQDLGFTIGSYFDGTSFPVPVDHRGRYLSVDGIEINASCTGDGDGIANVDFELADLTDTGNPMGIAADWRVVLHELGGHGILYDHINVANFGFSHSAGDSFAVILNDPSTQATDRFESFPWVSFIGRRHDRSVVAGWGWGGVNDIGGYQSEQVLSTTMFRVYRSIGGDSTNLSRREFAARCMAYLMLRAVGQLSPVSNPSSPVQFRDALLVADAGNWISEGLTGHAYGKVLTWSFEKQNLNDGARPDVDVYIDDGRAGEYNFLQEYWTTPAIWNRHSPGGNTHEEPIPGVSNYAYVKIKNRGVSVATNVVVEAYSGKPAATGLIWPVDFEPMTTPQLAAGSLQPNDTEEKTIGPFEWIPVKNAWGEDNILMIVTAPGDRSNAESLQSDESIEDWRLVPNDNNVGLRKVKFLPRLVLVIPDTGDFGNTCPGCFEDLTITLSNSGYSLLTVINIASSSGEFLVPSVLSYPLTIEAGTSVQVPIRFQPAGFGSKLAMITVVSDDPKGSKTVEVFGTAKPPRLAVVIANTGDFGKTCVGSFADEILCVRNSGPCPLSIMAITSSSPEFLVPSVLSFPLNVEAGGSIDLPIRFEPAGFGPKSATITITSNDPDGPRDVKVSGMAPSGKLAVTGSTCFGEVEYCHIAERTLSICNVGDCNLDVTKVAFSRKRRHFKLINNPFPATLRPGSCLSVVIQYKGSCDPECCELVIHSDDPITPTKILDVVAYTRCYKPCKPCDPCDPCGWDPCDHEEDGHGE